MTDATQQPIRTLIVDDDRDIRLLIRMIIETADEGLVVSCEAGSGAEALARLDECQPAVVVLDQMMPDVSGLETARQIRARRPALPIVLFSAYLTPDIVAAADEQGINACLAKAQSLRLPGLLRNLARAA